MPLNINLQQILLHALNFVILFGAMYFLLYKPVKSFMDSRKAHYEKMDEDAKAVLAEAEKTKAGYEAQLKSADEEIARRQREANEALQHAVDERRAQAEQQAGEIVRKAREDAAREHERVMEQAKKDSISKWGGKIPANLKLPLRDGDIDRPDDEAYAGCYFFNANSRQAPQVVDAKVLSEQPPLTYADYQSNVKPKPKKVETEKRIVGWRCKICNYVYEGSELPTDFSCPVCGHGPEDFEPIYAE